jgi:hypothetical protein
LPIKNKKPPVLAERGLYNLGLTIYYTTSSPRWFDNHHDVEDDERNKFIHQKIKSK